MLESRGRHPAVGSSSVDLRPLLAVQFDQGTLLVEDEEELFRFTGVEANRALRIINRIDGFRSRTDLLAVGDHCDSTFLDLLIDSGLVVARPALGYYDSGAVARALKTAYRSWNQRLFSHPLWLAIVNGVASEVLIVGWVLETYHFIRGASARLPLAIAQCSAGRQRDILAQHFSEEYDHDDLFLESLATLGIAESAARAASPLPGTAAVIDWMRAAARRDVLAYAGCSGLLESTGSDPVAAREFYDMLESHYPSLPDFVSPMRRHAAMDEGFAHGNVMTSVLGVEPRLEQGRVDTAVAYTYGFVEILEYWFTDILTHYATLDQFDATAVRRYRPATVNIGHKAADAKSGAPTSEPTPLISPAVEMAETEPQLRLEDSHEALVFSGESAALMRRVVPYLNGANTISAISEAIEASTQNVERHVQALASAGLVLDTAAAIKSTNGPSLKESLNSESRFWNRAFFSKPFFQNLHAGALTPPVVLGWGVEFFHFVRGAGQYMASGVAHCDPASTWLRALAAHYAEEGDHASIFLRGLERCGLDTSAIETASPLPTTQALLNRFSEIGVKSTISYAAVFAFMRPMENGRPVHESFSSLEHLARCYPFASGLFDAFAEHGRIDLELGHGESPLYALLSETGPLRPDQCDEAVVGLRTAAECFSSFVDGIHAAYGSQSLFWLRRPASFQGLPGLE